MLPDHTDLHPHQQERGSPYSDVVVEEQGQQWQPIEPGQMIGQEHELGHENEHRPASPKSKNCQHGSECEPSDSLKPGWNMYNYLQRFSSFINGHVNYRQNKWISTRELGRKLDQLHQYTHHHSTPDEITQDHFILLDARGKKEYRTSHIHGAIHMPISAHLCMFVRPGLGHVQKNFFDPPAHTPLRESKGEPILKMLEGIDKETEIVVYCAVGYRSGWIARALNLQGYNATAVYGGIYKWASEGREIYRYKSDRPNPPHGLKDLKQKFQMRKEPKPPKPKHRKRSKELEKEESVEKEMQKSMSDSSQNLLSTAEAGMDSQGMHSPPLARDEEPVTKIAPHQLLATQLSNPSLKPT